MLPHLTRLPEVTPCMRNVDGEHLTEREPDQRQEW